MIEVLNTHAGIGGNRKLWSKRYRVTAIELDPKIAAVYQDLYPSDRVIVSDANQFMLENHSRVFFFLLYHTRPTNSTYREKFCVSRNGVFFTCVHPYFN